VKIGGIIGVTAEAERELRLLFLRWVSKSTNTTEDFFLHHITEWEFEAGV
jgi:hypothetical protein